MDLGSAVLSAELALRTARRRRPRAGCAVPRSAGRRSGGGGGGRRRRRFERRGRRRSRRCAGRKDRPPRDGAGRGWWPTEPADVRRADGHASSSPTRTGCMPGRPHGWCRRFAVATRTRGSATAAANRNGLTRAAFRRSPRSVCGPETKSRSGCREARPPRPLTTSCRWPRATSTSRVDTADPYSQRRRRTSRSAPVLGWASGRPVRRGRAPSPSRTPRPRSPRSSGVGSARRSRRCGARISQLRTRTARDVGESEAAIFDAHQLLLDDAALLDSARSRIDDGQSAVSAWSAAVTGPGRRIRRHSGSVSAGPCRRCPRGRRSGLAGDAGWRRQLRRRRPVW